MYMTANHNTSDQLSPILYWNPQYTMDKNKDALAYQQRDEKCSATHGHFWTILARFGGVASRKKK